MDIFIEPIGKLVNEFSKLPGVGKKTLIRALAKALSSGEGALRCVMVDTRRELDDGSFGSCRSLDI